MFKNEFYWERNLLLVGLLHNKTQIPHSPTVSQIISISILQIIFASNNYWLHEKLAPTNV